jgi:adenylate kinase
VNSAIENSFLITQFQLVMEAQERVDFIKSSDHLRNKLTVKQRDVLLEAAQAMRDIQLNTLKVLLESAEGTKTD